MHHFEIFLWGNDNTDEEGFYKGSLFFGSQNRCLYALINTYDDANKGNIIKKIIYGNLTGTNNNFVALDGNNLPISNNEIYTKKFEYNNDNLITKETDEEGVSIEYSYLSNTNLLISKFIKHFDEIKQRFFYTYDNDNFLIEEIEDDGKSQNKKDLSDVTKRLIKKISPGKETGLYGFTSAVEEKLFKKEQIEYFQNGKIKQKDIFDADNVLRYSLNYTYDSKSNLETQTDLLGRTAKYKYDPNSNKIYEKDFSDKETFFEYDQKNRLIKKTLKVNNLDYTTKYQYDNLISETDPRGNTAYYKYDAFGNIIEKILPTVIDENKNLSQKVFKYEYDELGRCIKEISPTNDIIVKSYNHYGNPTYIKHPDNTEERFIYNKNGTLKKHINQTGTITEYNYDYQKRVTSKRCFLSKEKRYLKKILSIMLSI